MVAPPHRGSRYFPPCVLVELVKVPIIDTTKVRIRWFPQLEGDLAGVISQSLSI